MKISTIVELDNGVYVKLGDKVFIKQNGKPYIKGIVKIMQANDVQKNSREAITIVEEDNIVHTINIADIRDIEVISSGGWKVDKTDLKRIIISREGIYEGEAFKILCESLGMDFVLEAEEKNFVVKENEDEEKEVWLNDKKYDDRGELYEALIEVAKCIFPGFL